MLKFNKKITKKITKNEQKVSIFIKVLELSIPKNFSNILSILSIIPLKKIRGPHIYFLI